MAEEDGNYDLYAINSTTSDVKPIINVGDITAGLRTTLSGTTIKNGTRCNVNVSLPKEIANTSTDRDYHFAIKEHVVQDVRAVLNDYVEYDLSAALNTRFNRLLDYLENWIDDGNVNMSDLKQYVNGE